MFAFEGLMFGGGPCFLAVQYGLLCYDGLIMMVDWLVDCWMNWLIDEWMDWLTGGWMDWLSDGLAEIGMVADGVLDDGMVDWLVNWWIDWLMSWLVKWWIGWLIHWLIDGLTFCRVGWWDARWLDDWLQVTDFGLSRFKATSVSEKMTGQAGTYHWMAPEVRNSLDRFVVVVP